VLLAVLVVEKRGGDDLVHLWDACAGVKDDIWWSNQLWLRAVLEFHFTLICDTNCFDILGFYIPLRRMFCLNMC
jgi:hypothetical protein